MVRAARLAAVLGFISSEIMLAGCAGPAATTQAVAPPPAPAQPVVARHRQRATLPSDRPGDAIARLAHSLVGTPYRYGGDHPAQGFDCSGLVFFTHRQVNLRIPRTSRDQYRAARPVTLQQARPGDLVFFKDQSKLSHVGIYLGDQRFVHAPASGRHVAVARLDAPYYREHLVGLGRLY